MVYTALLHNRLHRARYSSHLSNQRTARRPASATMRRFTMIVMIIMLSAASACQLLTAAAEPGSPRTLVLIGDEGVRNTHSQLLKSFEALGAQLNVRRSSNSSLQLRHWDTWLYGNVVLLHPSATGLPPGRSPCAGRSSNQPPHRCLLLKCIRWPASDNSQTCSNGSLVGGSNASEIFKSSQLNQSLTYSHFDALMCCHAFPVLTLPTCLLRPHRAGRLSGHAASCGFCRRWGQPAGRVGLKRLRAHARAGFRVGH